MSGVDIGEHSSMSNLFKMLEGLHILSGGDRVSRPNDSRTNGDLHGTACAVDSQADSSTQSSHPEVDGAVEAEG